ncbi:hypothetical protein WS71_11735 [Burkholderia mayonis]|uniref:Uncharacterized protein n=1 Tax=Burkholderia mayonis TaxID=1385591 RepID=A0A1B4FW33_9BURK|nr:hypothetical protein WS71_11735 [Burkholderia mayonis]KVE55402.1 hypothetical protein WS71_02830 [Burkholderia mayonis]
MRGQASAVGRRATTLADALAATVRYFIERAGVASRAGRSHARHAHCIAPALARVSARGGPNAGA